MNVPAHILSRQGRDLSTALTSGLGGSRPAHISRLGNRFTLVDASGTKRPTLHTDNNQIYLDLIICDANPHQSRVYYEGGYDESNPSPPDCWSDNGVGPSAQCSDPQDTTCAACIARGGPGAWGTGVARKPGDTVPPACRSSKKLAVGVVDDDNELLYEFTIPAGSFKAWRKYSESIAAQQLGNNRTARITDVVTRVFFTDANGVLGFKPQRFLSEDEIAWQDDVWTRPEESQRLVGALDTPRALPAPKAPAPAATIALAPAPMPPPVPPAPAAISFAQAPADAPKPRGRPRKAVAAEPAPAPPAAPVKAVAAEPAPAPPAAPAEDMPPFLRRPPPLPQAFPQPPAQTAPQPMQAQPTTMDTGLVEALKLAFPDASIT